MLPNIIFEPKQTYLPNLHFLSYEAMELIEVRRPRAAERETDRYKNEILLHFTYRPRKLSE